MKLSLGTVGILAYCIFLHGKWRVTTSALRTRVWLLCRIMQQKSQRESAECYLALMVDSAKNSTYPNPSLLSDV